MASVRILKLARCLPCRDVMKVSKLEDFLTTELDRLYEAETQILRAMPKMIAAATSEELAETLQAHRDQTKGHLHRLDEIVEAIGEQPGSLRSEGIEGLIEESERLVRELDKSPALDAALILVAQKLERCEIAAYQMLQTIAEILGQRETSDLLQTTLDQETAADEALENLAEKMLTGTGSSEKRSGAG